MPRRTPAIERVDATRYRVSFHPPLEPEVALYYFGFYPDTELHWRNGKVVAVVAPVSVYERIVREFSHEPAQPEDAATEERTETRR
jgi:hypothetical protein